MKYFILNICCKICIAIDASFKNPWKRFVYTQGLHLFIHYVSDSPRPSRAHNRKMCILRNKKVPLFHLNTNQEVGFVLAFFCFSSFQSFRHWRMSGLMWFLHHDNMPSNHWASPADPSFPAPQILFLKSAHKEFAKLEVQLHCICSGFKSTRFLYYWDFPWSRFLFHKTYRSTKPIFVLQASTSISAS